MQGWIDKEKHITVFGNKDNLRHLLPGQNIHIKPRTASQLLKATFSSDVLMIGPGGLFPSANTAKLLFYLLITVVMKLRGKRAGYIGVGVGTGMFQSGINRFLINSITRFSDVFVSRSENYLCFQPKIKTERITLASDMIFSDPAILSDTPRCDSRLVVVAPANIFDGNSDEYRERFVREFAAFQKHITDRGYKIKMISFTNEKDRDLNERIAAETGSPNVTVAPFYEMPYDTLAQLKEAYICVGMRFHAIVMALSYGIPCLSVSYSDKNEDVMSRFGLDAYSARFGISDREYFNQEIMISSRKLIEMFDALVSHYSEIGNCIINRKKEMVELSLVNRKTLKELLTD